MVGERCCIFFEQEYRSVVLLGIFTDKMEKKKEEFEHKNVFH